MKKIHTGILLLISMPLYSIGQNKQTALTDLKSLLHTEKEWVKVHVAEFLLWGGYYMDEVRAEFLKEEQQSGHIPKYRIGIWRVLVQAAVDEKERQYWVDRIIAAYYDHEGEDRLHAIETLAKLKVCVVRHLPESVEGSFRLYSLWNQALVSTRSQQKVKDVLIKDLLDKELTELETHVTSYILRYIGPLSNKEYDQIKAWMGGRELSTAVQANLLATLLIACPENLPIGTKQMLKQELIALCGKIKSLPHIMTALAKKGDVNDRKIILDLYGSMGDRGSTDYNSDLHATAAYMVSKSIDM